MKQYVFTTGNGNAYTYTAENIHTALIALYHDLFNAGLDMPDAGQLQIAWQPAALDDDLQHPTP